MSDVTRYIEKRKQADLEFAFNFEEDYTHFKIEVLLRLAREIEAERDPDMLDNYDFSQGVRGKYVQRFAQGSNVVVLSPDIAEIFPDSESVNNALRLLVEIAGRSIGKAPAH